MDNSEDTKIAELESNLRAVQEWLQHPIATGLFHELDEEAESLLHVILEAPIHSIEAFFVREQSLGHLRGLRRAKAIVTEHAERVQEQLKALQ